MSDNELLSLALAFPVGIVAGCIVQAFSRKELLQCAGASAALCGAMGAAVMGRLLADAGPVSLPTMAAFSVALAFFGSMAGAWLANISSVASTEE